MPDAPPHEEKDSEGYFRCSARCGLVFKTKDSMNRYSHSLILLASNYIFHFIIFWFKWNTLPPPSPKRVIFSRTVHFLVKFPSINIHLLLTNWLVHPSTDNNNILDNFAFSNILTFFGRHVWKQHPQFQPMDVDEPSDSPEDKSEDHLYNYHRGKLIFGLFMLDLNDSIREADGQRLMNLYKIGLHFFNFHGCTK